MYGIYLMPKQKQENKTEAKQRLLCWTDKSWGDLQYWYKQNQDKYETIIDLLDECRRNPFKGKGKPEPLKGNLTGYWSRRIDREHRLVYLPEDGHIYVVSCRYHYE